MERRRLHTLLQQADLTGPYPATWDELAGQDGATAHLRGLCEQSERAGRLLAPVLLVSHEPGMGKRSLAVLAAARRGAALRRVVAPFTAADAATRLADAPARTVLIVEDVQCQVEVATLLALMEREGLGVIATTCAPAGVDPRVVAASTRIDLAAQEGYAALVLLAIALALRMKLDPLPAATDLRLVAEAAGGNPGRIVAIWQDLRARALADLHSVYLAQSEDGQPTYDLRPSLAALGLEGVAP